MKEKKIIIDKKRKAIKSYINRRNGILYNEFINGIPFINPRKSSPRKWDCVALTGIRAEENFNEFIENRDEFIICENNPEVIEIIKKDTKRLPQITIIEGNIFEKLPNFLHTKKLKIPLFNLDFCFDLERLRKDGLYHLIDSIFQERYGYFGFIITHKMGTYYEKEVNDLESHIKDLYQEEHSYIPKDFKIHSHYQDDNRIGNYNDVRGMFIRRNPQPSH